MWKQLKEIYPSLILSHPNDVDAADDFTWFVNNDQEIIGIHTSEITEKDEQILTAFLTPYQLILPNKTPEEQLWHTLIHYGTDEMPDSPFRFIYFSIQQHGIDPTSFKEAINELFDESVPVLWINETDGIIVEELTITSEKINYEQLIDIIMTDFASKIKFFIGETIHTFDRLHDYYERTIKSGHVIFSISNKDVIDYIEAIPSILLHKIDEGTKQLVIDAVLKELQHDEEMLETMQRFLDYNLNVSETAKQMYMHRNSLQYRIDKFTNVTGINIQKFDEAITVQLALLLKDSLH